MVCYWLCSLLVLKIKAQSALPSINPSPECHDRDEIDELEFLPLEVASACTISFFRLRLDIPGCTSYYHLTGVLVHNNLGGVMVGPALGGCPPINLFVVFKF